jgi:acetyl esterase/lipase
VSPVEHRYVEHDDSDPALTSLDVYAADDAAGCPVLIWVHGGSWQAGEKDTRATQVKADHFVAQGWVFISVNYRLVAEDNDVRWPDFGEDVAAAVAWTIEHGDELGIDTAQLSLIGHSAGAHLVSTVGTNERLLDGYGAGIGDLRCVVSLDSASYDLTDPPPWGLETIELAFPTDGALVDASPTLQAEAGDPSLGPAFLIVTRGRQERLDGSARLATALTTGGGEAIVVDVSPYDHRDVNRELGVVGETVLTPVVDEFLAGCRDAVATG